MDELTVMSSRGHVRVRSPQRDRLGEPLRAGGATVAEDGAETLIVRGIGAPSVGELAARHGVVLHELFAQEVSLEEAFMELTSGAVDYRAPSGTSGLGV